MCPGLLQRQAVESEGQGPNEEITGTGGLERGRRHTLERCHVTLGGTWAGESSSRHLELGRWAWREIPDLSATGCQALWAQERGHVERHTGGTLRHPSIPGEEEVQMQEMPGEGTTGGCLKLREEVSQRRDVGNRVNGQGEAVGGEG